MQARAAAKEPADHFAQGLVRDLTAEQINGTNGTSTDDTTTAAATRHRRSTKSTAGLLFVVLLKAYDAVYAGAKTVKAWEQLVLQLIEHGADPAQVFPDLNNHGVKDACFLHYAVWCGMPLVVYMLLQASLDRALPRRRREAAECGDLSAARWRGLVI